MCNNLQEFNTQLQYDPTESITSIRAILNAEEI